MFPKEMNAISILVKCWALTKSQCVLYQMIARNLNFNICRDLISFANLALFNMSDGFTGYRIVLQLLGCRELKSVSYCF